MDSPFNFDRTIEGLTKVTLRGGVVGKVTFAIVVVSITLGFISWSVSNIWLSAVALIMVFTLAFVMLWRLINFADRNPKAALLEGAEFLVHEQILHASKSEPSISLSSNEQIQPETIDITDPILAERPDIEALPNQGESN